MQRTPKCSRCRNHGFLVAVKGHAGNCRWKQCTCEKCCLITERQKIMAAQKMLRKQAAEEDKELASRSATAGPASSLRPLPPLSAPGAEEPGPQGPAAAYRPPSGPGPSPSAFQPVPAGRGHMGASERAAVARPGFVGPQLGAEAAGRGGPGLLGVRRPLLPLATPPFSFGVALSINSDSAAGPEYLGREPPKLYPSMHAYRPFPLGYQDAPPGLRIPLQQGFRHVPCRSYQGRIPVSEPMGTFQPNYPPLPPPLLPPPLPPQPHYIPPGFFSAVRFLPPPPPPPPPASFSVPIPSDTDQQAPNDQDGEMPSEPSQPSSQEQSN
ncbi:doublesex- and mab-3-related transcription factor B1 [Saccopteryx bilineata]|uniref:doublesex- and mab-3-related transcription factor B1 n=1 Tax=Saccopteryx bilineata TaxID=59482 RepID=UPI00338FC030